MSLFGNDALTIKSYRLQKTFNFECLMPLVGIADPLKISRLVQGFNYSDYEMPGVQGMRYGAYQAFYAGFMTKREFNVTFLETEDHDVKRYLNAWRNLIVDRHGRFNKKKGFLFGYAKPIFLHYLNSKGHTTNVVEFKYAFPVSFTQWRTSYNESTVQKIDASFVCDEIREIRDIVANPIEDFVKTKIPEIFVPAANKSAAPGA